MIKLRAIIIWIKVLWSIIFETEKLPYDHIPKAEELWEDDVAVIAMTGIVYIRAEYCPPGRYILYNDGTGWDLVEPSVESIQAFYEYKKEESNHDKAISQNEAEQEPLRESAL